LQSTSKTKFLIADLNPKEDLEISPMPLLLSGLVAHDSIEIYTSRNKNKN